MLDSQTVVHEPELPIVVDPFKVKKFLGIFVMSTNLPELVNANLFRATELVWPRFWLLQKKSNYKVAVRARADISLRKVNKQQSML
jgi:hypothetical protein